MKLSDLKSRYEIGEVLIEMGLNGSGAEVGVAFGENAEKILGGSRLSTLFLVDPWGYVPGQNPMGFGDAIRDWNGCFNYCKRKLARFGNRAKYLRMSSADAAATIADGTLDFVYIDGNHMSPYVDADLELWYPKMKTGGVFGGHDYMVLRNPDYHCDVKTAVDSFAEKNSLEIHLADQVDSSWYVIKK